MEKIKHFFLWITTPFQNLLSYFSNPEPKMTEYLVGKILAKAKPGYALFSYEKWRLTNWLIRGEYDHAAIIALDQGKLVVVEAIKPVVIKTPLVEWLYKKDDVAIGRRKAKDDKFHEDAGAYALKQVGDEYDTLFHRYRRNSSKHKTYCSKLVANSLRIFFTGELEPVELMRHKQMEILDNTKKGG